ncbi:MAG: SUMF1/EgtB/PvdO family nonheme iron enzyme [Myxococcales bacterium]|nr:SUMF1/EgtB/PvdO family nonheme iron enzyme [Myxococcales bacterium]
MGIVLLFCLSFAFALLRLYAKREELRKAKVSEKPALAIFGGAAEVIEQSRLPETKVEPVEFQKASTASEKACALGLTDLRQERDKELFFAPETKLEFEAQDGAYVVSFGEFEFRGGDKSRGGMGQVVRLLRSTWPSQSIILKFLSPGHLEFFGAYHKRLYQSYEVEAKAYVAFNSHAVRGVPVFFKTGTITRTFDGVETEFPYLLLQDGGPRTLHEEIIDWGKAYTKDKSLPRNHLSHVISVIYSLCMILDEVHHLKIIHRDIKPDQIFLDREGNLCLGDWGLAVIGQVTLSLGPDGQHYKAPELKKREEEDIQVAQGHEREDEKNKREYEILPSVDIYSVGVLFFRMLTFRYPETSREGGDSLASVNADRERLRSLGYHGDLIDIVMKMKHRDPAVRYSSALGVSGDLFRYVHKKSILDKALGGLNLQSVQEELEKIKRETERLERENASLQELSEQNDAYRQVSEHKIQGLQSQVQILRQTRFKFATGDKMKIAALHDAEAIYVAPGSFRSPNWWGGEVTLTRGLFVLSVPVTQRMFLDLMGYNPSFFQGDLVTKEAWREHFFTSNFWGQSEGRKGDFFEYWWECFQKERYVPDLERPVECVSWHEAAAFCNALSARQGLQEVYLIEGEGRKVSASISLKFSDKKYYDAEGWRLPTEAEWEFLCRAGTDGERYGDLDEIAWYRDNSGSMTHPVVQRQGSVPKRANSWGIQHTLGNVWEWCYDTRNSDLEAATNPVETAVSTNRVDRGGGWNGNASNLRAADRDYDTPAARVSNLGFRVVRSSL